MPRDLTDLMERATSVAPPEPHAAADVTRVAARHLRRRTTNLVAGVTAAVLVAGSLGYAVSRGHDSTPEPAKHLDYGQQLRLADAVPATAVPGFRELHYSIKPVDQKPISQRRERLGLPPREFVEYRDIDSAGRLVVVRGTGGFDAPDVPIVLAGPDSTSSMLAASPPAVKNGSNANGWVPSFVGDGRLLWTPYLPVVGDGQPQVHVTDLVGHHDQPLVMDRSKPAPGNGGLDVWVSGDRLWFVNQDLPGKDLTAAPTSTLYSTPIDDPTQLTTVAAHVVDAAASDGAVGWVTRDGLGHLGTTTGRISTFRLPLDRGCTVYPWSAQLGQFAVTDGLLAFAEECGSGKAKRSEPVVVDPSGRLVLHVNAPGAGNFALNGAAFAFFGIGGPSDARTGVYHVDLRTGVMSILGAEHSSSGAPVVAGRYVLWHDSASYHVGEFTG